MTEMMKSYGMSDEKIAKANKKMAKYNAMTDDEKAAYKEKMKKRYGGKGKKGGKRGRGGKKS